MRLRAAQFKSRARAPDSAGVAPDQWSGRGAGRIPRPGAHPSMTVAIAGGEQIISGHAVIHGILSSIHKESLFQRDRTKRRCLPCVSRANVETCLQFVGGRVDERDHIVQS